MAKTVRELFNDYMEHSDKSQNAVSQSIGVSTTVLSQWINEKYPGDIIKLEKKIESYLLREFTRSTHMVNEQFVKTKLAHEILEVLSYCHTFKDMGVVYGSPGLGKTITAQEYHRNHPDTIFLTAFQGFTWTAIVGHLADIVGVTNRISGYRKVQRVAEVLRGSDRLIIIDEAQFLSNSSLEIVRSIHDQSGVGVVYMGQPSVMSRL